VAVGFPDWFPLWLDIVIIAIAGIGLVVGLVYVLFWEADVIIGGSIDEARELGQRFIVRRTRRKLDRH
jgi:hypothetical protein